MRPVIASPPPAPRRRGDARLLLLLALALAAVAWLVWSGGSNAPEAGESEAVAPAAEPQPAPQVSVGALGPELERRDEATAPTTGGPGLPGGVRPAPDGRRVGVLRGRLSLRDVPGLSEPWTLELAPSQFALGAELAEPRSIELPADQREFEVRDLPLAGYDVRAVYPGLNGRALPVILRKGAEEAYAVIELSPAAAVTGKLIDGEGFGYADVAVHLRPNDTSLDQSTVTDALGHFRFYEVIDGAYSLRVGDAQAPILEPLFLQVRAPLLALPDLELPPLGTLIIDVIDIEGRAVPDVEVLGGGTLGGSIDVRTDGLGSATATALPAGQYSLRANVEGVGKGFARVNIDPAAGPARARVILRP
jgi:hypothetical protein